MATPLRALLLPLLASGCTVLAWAAAVPPEPRAAPADGQALATDDECHEAAEDGACAVNALQRLAVGRRKTEAAAEDAPSDVLDLLEAGAAALGTDGEPDGGAPEDEEAAADATGAGMRLLGGNDTIETELGADLGYACPMVPWKGPNYGAESCFCHKARNPSCKAAKCSCREGCQGTLQANIQSVTFWNQAHVSNCPGALLTIPRPFVRDIRALPRECGQSGAVSMLTAMLTDGYLGFITHVRPGKVMQCIHKASMVSVHWLHLHSFCPGGRVDGLPDKATSYCATMDSVAQAGAIARKFLGWMR